MSPEQASLEAEEALAEIARIRTTTRGTVRSLAWHTSVLWGLVFLIPVPIWLAFENNVVSSAYWFVAVPLAILTTWTLESSLPRLNNSVSFGPAFAVISSFMVIGAFGSWWVTDERNAVLIWFSVLLLGFAAFAWMDRLFWAVAGCGLLWLWGVAVWLSLSDTRADLDFTLALFSTAIGAGMLGTGFGKRLGRPS